MAAWAEVFVDLGPSDTHSLMARGTDWIWVDQEGSQSIHAVHCLRWLWPVQNDQVIRLSYSVLCEAFILEED